jgi:hypothetical protein
VAPPQYGTLLPLAARTATVAPLTPLKTVGAVLLHVVVNVTANPGAQTLTLALYGGVPTGPAPGSAGTTFVTFPNITGNGVFQYFVGTGTGTTTAGTTFAGAVVGVPPPAAWTVGVTHSGVGSWTYSVDYAAT